MVRIFRLQGLVVQRRHNVRLITPFQSQSQTVCLIEWKLQCIKQTVGILPVHIAVHLRADGLSVQRDLPVQTARKILITEQKLVTI